MCLAWSASFARPVASELGSTMPPTGNQPSPTANAVSSSMPSQKSGMAYVAMVKRRHRVVGLRPSSPARGDAEHHAEDRRQQRRDPDERDGRPRLAPDLRGDRLVGGVRAPEVQLRGLPDVAHELLAGGAVEAELLGELGALALAEVAPAEEVGDRVALDDAEEEEVEGDDEGERRQGAEDLGGDEAGAHSRSSAVRRRIATAARAEHDHRDDDDRDHPAAAAAAVIAAARSRCPPPPA